MGPRLSCAVAAVVLLGIGAAACSGSEPAATTTSTAVADSSTTTQADAPPAPPTGPPLIEDFPRIEVMAPPQSDAGEVPMFRWEPVAGAVQYELVVMGPELPIWAWQGDATEVWLGGLSVERPPEMAGPVIVAGTCWSVIARDADDAITAASDLLAVSPDDSTHTCQPGSG
jgi:hypothetical protein